MAIQRAAFLSILLLTAEQASAHVVLSQPDFQPGVNYAAFFKVGHGCGASPTASLRVEIPDGVTLLDAPAKSGWKVAATKPARTVTWSGRLDAKTADQFGLLLKLPMKTGPIYFPTIQTCESGVERWTGIPKPGQAWRDLDHPAPVLNIGAPGDMTAMANMPGMNHDPVPATGRQENVTIREAWIRALPAGVPAAGYFTAHNMSTAKLTIVSARSPACASLMMHRSVVSGSNAGMEMMATVDIPPGGEVEFSPRGYHLMCVNPSPAIKPGGTVPVTLSFAGGTETTADFPVRNALGK